MSLLSSNFKETSFFFLSFQLYGKIIIEACPISDDIRANRVDKNNCGNLYRKNHF